MVCPLLSSAIEEATLQRDRGNMMSAVENAASLVILTPLHFQAARHHGETGSGEVAKRRLLSSPFLSVESEEATATILLLRSWAIIP